MVSDYVNRRLDAIENVSKQGKRVVKLYNLMQMKEIWFQAYQHIASNKGAVTPGPDEVTQDGFSEGRVENLIDTLKSGLYHSKPARRSYIPKANGKLRPLGIPAGDEKLIQEVCRLLLECIYEPVFSEDSHGFRPGRSCHTALRHVRTWKSTIWFVEFDIKGFFDHVDHKILLGALAKKIDDRKFLNVIRNMLRAGYLEDWKYHRTYSGTPQGGVISPILSNIYLHDLDQYVNELKEEYNVGEVRAKSKDWLKLTHRISYLRNKIDKIREMHGSPLEENEIQREIKSLISQRTQIASTVPDDPDYRRLWYCRYADDFLLGVIGSYTVAQEIQQKIQTYLETSLSLETAKEKTGICHASKPIVFLGYEILTIRNDKTLKVTTEYGRATRIRTMNGNLTLRVPKSKVTAFCKNKHYGTLESGGMKPRPYLVNHSEVETILLYNAEMRGFANYYALAVDVKQKLKMLSYIATYSCLATLAFKHKTGISNMARRMRVGKDFYWKTQDAKGRLRSYKIWQLKDLKPPAMGTEVDRTPNPYIYGTKTDLGKRLEAEECEYCGEQGGYFEVHHVKKLKDLKDKTQLKPWEVRMIQRQRKTLILCVHCHDRLHAGTLPDMRDDLRLGSQEPSRK